MLFDGWQKTSLIEYPGRIATVVFVGGCNLRCPWCYNPELALGRAGEGGIEEERVLAHLDAARKLYQAVVVTGGEPCLSPGLQDFLLKVRERGLFAGLETNGTFPEVLARLLERRLLDYVGIDVKAPADGGLMARATGVGAAGAAAAGVVARVSESLRLLAASDLEAEARTTVVPGLHGRRELEAIAEWLGGVGWLASPRRRWAMQRYEPGAVLDPGFASGAGCPREAVEEVARGAGGLVELRGFGEGR